MYNFNVIIIVERQISMCSEVMWVKFDYEKYKFEEI